MPFGKWQDFESCILDMKNQGHDEESAKRICGSMKAKVENNTKEFESIKLSDDDKKVVEEYIRNDVNIYTETLDNVEIFSVGIWNKDRYNEKDVKNLVQNFDELKDVVKPPAKIGHSERQEMLKKEGLPAAGWVDKLQMVGNKVVATFKDVPKVVKDLIDKKAYKRVSAEIYPKYKHPTTGKIYNNVLRAVAFLGADVPAVETLSDVLAWHNNSDESQSFNTYTFNIGNFNKKSVEVNFISNPITIKIKEIN